VAAALDQIAGGITKLAVAVRGDAPTTKRRTRRRASSDS
jgi:hypothetical protein